MVSVKIACEIPFVTKMSNVRLLDYDCIGFDWDNTLCRYNLPNLIQLGYDTLAKFLVDDKGYESDLLLQPLDLEFLRKGLILDLERGNVLHISDSGQILKASHGTHFLNSTELETYYGQNKTWDMMVEFSKNIMEGWSGELSQKFRIFLDYFNLPYTLVFARLIDTVDKRNAGQQIEYNVWPDILEGINQMLLRDNFSSDTGGFFPALKRNPDLYVNKCSPQVVEWLKSIRSANKIIFLVTGSHIDFLDFTASICLGHDWKNLFDFVVSFSRKPGFFFERRPFLALNNSVECDPVDPDNMVLGEVYSQGNWQDMIKLFQRRTGKAQPMCLYFGDHLVQDVYAPSEYVQCHTVAVVEELEAESVVDPVQIQQNNCVLLTSKAWGSLFTSSNVDKVNSNPVQKLDTMWGAILRNNCKLCISGIDDIAVLPLDYSFKAFSQDQMGFYPEDLLVH